MVRLADLQAQEAAKAEAAAAAAEAALASIAAKRPDNQQGAAVSVAAAKPATPSGGKSGVGVWIGGGIAILGIAAAFALYQSRKPEAPPVTTTTEPQAKPQPSSAQVAGDVPKPQPTAEPAPQVASSEPAPAPSGAPKVADAKTSDVKDDGAGAPPATAVANNDPKPSTRSDKPQGGPVGTLDEEMKKTVNANDLPVAPQDDGSKPAAGGGGNVPDQPSQGNAQAAVRTVLPAARACVAGASDPTTASITFSSSGSVQSVSVGGWAASNGQSACVKSALQGARVSPFAKPTFTVPVTIRP